MMKGMRVFTLLLVVFGVTIAWAQGPNGTQTYYQGADGLKGRALKTALFQIIDRGALDKGYDALPSAYAKTDLRADGTIWDIYSNVTKYKLSDSGASASKEGGGWNREHTVPQSWFDRGTPMRNDVFHVYPTDISINSMRSSFPYGEVGTPTKTSQNGFSKLGASVTPGYTKTVFEPADEYKGDLARTYFYMATRYENRINNWKAGESVFGVGTYPGIADWQLKLLLKWAKNDPVSEKEIARNNAAYAFQNTRNPYIDYPGLEQYVWGDSVDVAFNYANYGKPTTPSTNPGGESPTVPTDPTTPATPENPSVPAPVTPIAGQVVFVKVTSLSDLEIGARYLIVSESESKALGNVSAKVRSYAGVSIIGGNTIQTAVDGEGDPRSVILGGTAGSYTFYDTVEQVYLSLNENGNSLQSITSDPSSKIGAQWLITVVNGEMRIANSKYSTRYIKYNTTAPRFACYSTEGSTLKYATLYKLVTTTGIQSIEKTNDIDISVDVYNMSGVLVRSSVPYSRALEGLPKGIYFVGGKKFVVK